MPGTCSSMHGKRGRPDERLLTCSAIHCRTWRSLRRCMEMSACSALYLSCRKYQTSSTGALLSVIACRCFWVFSSARRVRIRVGSRSLLRLYDFTIRPAFAVALSLGSSCSNGSEMSHAIGQVPVVGTLEHMAHPNELEERSSDPFQLIGVCHVL